MSEQAIETEENETTEGFDIIEGPEPEVEAEAETEETEIKAASTEDDSELEAAESEETEDGEVEIVLEGEEEPTSTPAPRGVKRLLNRLDNAKSETDEIRRELEASRAEAELYRKRFEQIEKPKDVKPNIDDFDTDSEYQSALEDHYKRVAEQAAAEKVQSVIAETQQQTTQAQKGHVRNQKLAEHYKRVDEINIKDYDTLEGTAIELMGQDFIEELAANTEGAPLLIAHLATNPGKAEKYAQMARSEPVKALLEIGALLPDLKPKRKRSPAASPETKIKKGLASTNSDNMGIRYY